MLKLDPFALTDVGRRRDHNEDFLGDIIFKSGRKYGPEKLKEKGYLFAVADGMGGHAAGEVASEMAITTLFERYYNGPSSGDLGTDLREAVLEANREVHLAGMSNGRGQMGTTLTLALIVGNQLVVGNVGDSRTYLIHQGQTLRLTHDHSLVQDQIDMGVLTPEQAEHSMIRNVITRAVGHRGEVEPDFFERELEASDILLLCSDGLHGAVKEDELGQIVTSSPSLAEAGQKLINLANERGGVDNISVLLVAVTELGDPIPPLLNGRASFYPDPSSQAKTERFGDTPTDKISKPRIQVVEEVPDRSEITKFIDASNQPTVPNPVLIKTPTPEPDPKKFTGENASGPPIPATKSFKKKKGFGLFIILAVAVILAAAAVGAYFLFFETPTPAVAPAPSPVPAVTFPPTVPGPTSTEPTITLPPTVTKSALEVNVLGSLNPENSSQTGESSNEFFQIKTEKRSSWSQNSSGFY